jgi:electron transfer flavoprotein alpha subunit
MSVLVFVEQRGGVLNRLSLETITAGRQISEKLNASLEAAVIGASAGEIASQVAKYGVTKAYSAEHALAADYTADGFASAAEQVVKKVEPEIVLFPHTYQVRDFAPKLAARFGRALISDVVSVQSGDGSLALVRQLFQGKLNADVIINGQKLVFASIQAGAFRAAEQGSTTAPVETIDITLAEDQIRSKPEPPFREAQRSVDLSTADLIVSVGRGIREKENLSLVESLAEALGAELAASRPICDNGWLPMERQVGSSGQTVAPKAYFAIGISGAIQHLVGMKGAKTVVAINKDENAPIFEIADYGIVGDLFEVVPALTEEIKKVKG